MKSVGVVTTWGRLRVTVHHPEREELLVNLHCLTDQTVPRNEQIVLVKQVR